MRIEPFRLERYFAKYEFEVPYLMGASDCESITIDELLKMEAGSENEFLDLRLGYTESEGHPLLREQIANLYQGISPHEVLVHSGAEEAIFNLMNAHLSQNDHMIVHYPCYQSLMEVAKSIGCEVTFWKARERNRWTLDLDDLKRCLRPNTKLVVINLPHNPTGYLMPHQEFSQLVNLSQTHGFIIFSDEVYRLLEYETEDRLAAICELDDRSISLGVMSKSFGLAGLRIGWIATHNRSLYQKLASYKDYTTICNSAPSEFLSLVALKNKDRLLKRNLGIVKPNLALANSFFKRYAELFSWIPPKAGSIAFPGLRQGNVESFCHQLVSHAGVLLVPGTLYDASSANFRIGLGRANFKTCIHKLEDYITRQSRSLIEN